MPPLPSLVVSLVGFLLWTGHTAGALTIPNATLAAIQTKDTAVWPPNDLGVPRYRRKRSISAQDMNTLLEYHNHARATVYPPAANMEYMVWDEQLAWYAKAWATQCIWDHGPLQMMKSMGQNLSIYSGRYRSVGDLMKTWYEERRYYSFPTQENCAPRCPWLCNGSVCTHYTQMVWASSNRLGCAIHTCPIINVWGTTWHQATYLVCNYATKGNWIGEAPYKMGRPCSACPPSYQGTCRNNMCFPGLKSNRLQWA
uniref:peptidase inhibitor R3HDML n=1 Tax=Jaculus jaculus TaxID=51337 RepID=UPI001E1B08A3|nr:peptidase inhibitor R3HDML [Jaculus jaculus]